MPPERPVHLRDKWRPSLALVLGGTLGVVLVLPVFAMLARREVGYSIGWDVSFAIALALVVTVVAVLGFLLWRLLMRPIRALAVHSQQVVQNPDARPPTVQHYGTAELRHLGQSVMDMSHSLTGRTQMLQAYIDHVTHELKSPLTSIAGAAELLENPDLAPNVRDDLIKDLAFSADRMAQLLDSMRTYRASVGTVWHGTPTKLDKIALPNVVPLRFFGSPSLPISQEAAEAILTQFVRNSAEHGASRVDICATADGVVIADDGSGVSQGNEQRIFEPFFTTKRGAGGTGMGLAIVKTMLEHGGLAVDLWQKNGGCVFAIRPWREIVPYSPRSESRTP